MFGGAEQKNRARETEFFRKESTTCFPDLPAGGLSRGFWQAGRQLT
jgi:hypothetical protein